MCDRHWLWLPLLAMSGFVRSASAKDVLEMTKPEFAALSKEQADALPYADAMAVVLSDWDTTKRPEARKMTAFVLSRALHTLMYLQVPSAEGGPALTKAVREFQAALGVPQTGVLLVREWEKLSEAAEKMEPGRIGLPRDIVWGNSGFASAMGTWVFENDSQAFPLQTSSISCYKRSGECEETQVEIDSGNALRLSHSYYKVTKWTADEVAAENDSPDCVSYTLTLSLRKEQAHLFRRGKGAKDCERFGSKPQILRLVDGSKVAREYYERREAEGSKLAHPEFARALEQMRAMNRK